MPAAAALPVLIAQTPRAGRWNHVTLLPPGGLPAGLNPSDVLGAAAGRPDGEGYLAAVRTVPQAGVTKEGREVLAVVWCGVRPGLAETRVREWLAGRLVELGRRVEGIDWAAHDGGDYRLPDLAEWAGEVQRLIALDPEGRGGPTGTAPGRTTRRRWAYAGGVMAAGLLAAGVAVVGRPGAGGKPPGTTAKPKTGVVDPVVPKDEVDRFVARFGGEGIEGLARRIRRSLRDVTSRDGRGPAPGLAADPDPSHGPVDDLRRTRGESPAFAEWLHAHYGDAGGDGRWHVLGPPSERDRPRLDEIEAVVGPLRSAEDVLDGMRRLEELRRGLWEAAGEPAPLPPATRRSVAVDLIRMTRPETSPKDRELPVLPFFTPDSLGLAYGVAQDATRLGLDLDRANRAALWGAVRGRLDRLDGLADRVGRRRAVDGAGGGATQRND